MSRQARLVLGGVASAPVRLAASEQALVGRRLDDGAIAEAAEAAAGPVPPDGQHGLFLSLA